MTKDFNYSQHNFRFWYYRYKDSPYFSFVFIFATIAICIYLFINIILPQIQDWLSIREEVVATQEKIDTIRNNMTLVNSINKSDLTSQLRVTSSVLPPDKDFSFILQAISNAAIHSGVSMQDYSFQVGNISAEPMQSNPEQLPNVKVILALEGNLDTIQQFLKELSVNYPLSEVVSLTAYTTTTNVTILFYEKQFPKITYQDEEPIHGLSEEQVSLINKLYTWQSANAAAPVVSASDSAVPLF